MSSFRSRIRGSTLLLIAFLLVTFSVLLYGSLSTLLNRHVDVSLLALAQAEAKQVELTTGRVEVLASARGDDEDDEDEEDMREHRQTDHEARELLEAIRSSVVLGATGDVVWRGDAVGAYGPSAKATLARAWQGETVYETIRTVSGPTLRRISLPIGVAGEVRYLLQTETSLEFVEDTLRWLLGALAAVSIVVLALAWIGSGWLARKALTPVETLSNTANEISGKTLSTRLVLDAPYVEFQQLAHAFNGMLERLYKVFEAQRRFVADAAHELKTPLTAMKGNLEVTLQKARTPDTYREAISASLTSVDRLIRLTRSLLTLAQFAGDRPPVQFQPLELAPLVHEVLSDLTVLAEDRGIKLLEDLQAVPRVHGDAAQVRQLLINLLDNAIRYTPRGGRIEVRLWHHENDVFLSVKDTGRGIEPQHLPHLFDRFYRIDAARDQRTGGTGLGLAIVKEIAEAHGGTSMVESEIGKGSIFTVRIPAAMRSESPNLRRQEPSP